MFSKNTLENFSNRYSNLNNEQKKAVDTLEGPVMVIAGPGTGKTEILALRAANILQLTDVYPSSILCLTFTEKGSLNMRQRLLSIIGSDADRIHIHTFHSFCNLVIQENKDVFHVSDTELIDPVEQQEILNEILYELPTSSILKKYTEIKYLEYARRDLIEVFELMQKENWDVEMSVRKIDDYIKNLPDLQEFKYKVNRGKYKKGDPNLTKINTETEKMEKLKERIRLFDIYKKKLKDKNLYTYHDMILWVLEAFKNYPNILANYQERFLYFMVDEYQDTNGSQNQILYYLVDFWKNPNVFVVGDDDQSIFRFQGANTENMLDFYQRFEQNITTVLLTKNYRSSQKILDVSEELIKRCSSRLTNTLSFIEKKIKSELANGSLEDVRVYEFQNKKMEMSWLMEKIRMLQKENVPLNSIAVIFKKNVIGSNLIPYLNHHNIPFELSREDDILQSTFINQLITILTYFEKEIEKPFSSHDELFQILHYDFFEIPAFLIHTLATKIVNKKDDSKESQNKKKCTYTLRQKIQEESDKNHPSLFNKKSGLEKVIEIHLKLEQLFLDYHNLAFQQWVYKLIQDLNILHTIFSLPNKKIYFEELEVFFDLIKKECRKNPHLGLGEFLDVVASYRSNKQSVAIKRIFKAETGVQLLTFHSSKGLEFEHVFLFDMTKKSFEQSGRTAMALPPTFTKNHSQTDKQEDDYRIFYVGITRAKKRVYISYALEGEGNKKQEQSTFVNILKEYGLPTYTNDIPNTDTITTILSSPYFSNPLDALSANQSFMNDMKELLSHFFLNATALNNFIECPILFYYSNILRIPKPLNSANTYGTVIHDTLKYFFDVAKQTHQSSSILSYDDVMKCFYSEMKKYAWAFSKQEYQNRMEQGEVELKHFYHSYMLTNMANIFKNECTISRVFWNDIRMKGKIDKVEYTKQKDVIKIVDYKTGSYKNALPKLSPPNDKNPYGGSYWRQAMFYIILIEFLRYKNWKVREVDFVFLTPPEKDENAYLTHSVTHVDEQVAQMKKIIKETWDKIYTYDFFKEFCNNPDCEYCLFFKKYRLK